MSTTGLRRGACGFTLVELLMSLAILGMLMAAVAVAFDASVMNYQANEGMYRAVNTGRQTLLRITNDVRTAQAVATLGLPPNDPPSQLSLITADGQSITYRFAPLENTLYLHTADDDYVMCRNVMSMTFNRSPQNVQPIRKERKVITNRVERSEVTQTIDAAP